MELLCRVDICIPAAPRYWQKHFPPFLLPAKRGRPQAWQVDGAGFWHSHTIQGSSVSTAEVCIESTKMDVGTNVTFYRTVVILYCLSKGAASHQPGINPGTAGSGHNINSVFLPAQARSLSLLLSGCSWQLQGLQEGLIPPLWGNLLPQGVPSPSKPPPTLPGICQPAKPSASLKKHT